MNSQLKQRIIGGVILLVVIIAFVSLIFHQSGTKSTLPSIANQTATPKPAEKLEQPITLTVNGSEQNLDQQAKQSPDKDQIIESPNQLTLPGKKRTEQDQIQAESQPQPQSQPQTQVQLQPQTQAVTDHVEPAVPESTATPSTSSTQTKPKSFGNPELAASGTSPAANTTEDITTDTSADAAANAVEPSPSPSVTPSAAPNATPSATPSVPPSSVSAPPKAKKQSEQQAANLPKSSDTMPTTDVEESTTTLDENAEQVKPAAAEVASPTPALSSEQNMLRHHHTLKKKTAAETPITLKTTKHAAVSTSSTAKAGKTKGNWTVQVGSFSNLENGNRLVKQLRAKGFPVKSREINVASTGTMLHVSIGPVSHQEAIRIQKVVQSNFHVQPLVKQSL